MTVLLKQSDKTGRVVVQCLDDFGLVGRTDEVPVSMLRSLREQWVAAGWTVVDERCPAQPPMARGVAPEPGPPGPGDLPPDWP